LSLQEAESTNPGLSLGRGSNKHTLVELMGQLSNPRLTEKLDKILA